MCVCVYVCRRRRSTRHPLLLLLLDGAGIGGSGGENEEEEEEEEEKEQGGFLNRRLDLDGPCLNFGKWWEWPQYIRGEFEVSWWPKATTHYNKKPLVIETGCSGADAPVKALAMLLGEAGVFHLRSADNDE
eukprot:771028-Pyramimonas_sp.AAC.1